jgi:hypothetical protein
MRIPTLVSEQKPLKKHFLLLYCIFPSSHNPLNGMHLVPFHIFPSIYARVFVGNDRKIFVLPARQEGSGFLCVIECIRVGEKSCSGCFSAARFHFLSAPRRVCRKFTISKRERPVGWKGWGCFSRTRVCVFGQDAAAGSEAKLRKGARVSRVLLSRINKLRLAEKMWAISEKLPTATAAELNSRANEVLGENSTLFTQN